MHGHGRGNQRGGPWGPAPRPTALFTCACCLADAPAHDGASPMSPVIPGLVCQHRVCSTCLSGHAASTLRARRSATVPCVASSPAAGGCALAFAPEDVERSLRGSPADLALYHELLALSSVSCGLYCPHESCGAFLEASDEEAEDAEAGPFATCPACSRALCAHCRVPWHADMTCAQFAALPAAQRLPPARVALEAAARSLGWKACPSCGHLVERADGCNFITCHCGAGFCCASSIYVKPAAAISSLTPLSPDSCGAK